MNITNSATGQAVTIRADNVVVGPEGSLLVEAMFSGKADLTHPSANLAARLHPVKATAFEWIITRQADSVVPTGPQEGPFSLAAGEPINVFPDVEIHVNRPEGGTQVRHFAEFLDRSQRLLRDKSDEEVASTITLTGFDPEAEPILRQMRDGSLLLVFGFLPPLVTETAPEKAQFQMDTLGTELEAAVGVAVVWDDREVFVIQKPKDDTVERIRDFIATYWERRQKPWWKIW